MATFPMTLSDPNPGFKVTGYLQVKYLKKRCVLGTKLLKNTNRKPYTSLKKVLNTSCFWTCFWTLLSGSHCVTHCLICTCDSEQINEWMNEWMNWSERLKVSNDGEWLMASGRLFQACGLATAKARSVTQCWPSCSRHHQVGWCDWPQTTPWFNARHRTYCLLKVAWCWSV